MSTSRSRSPARWTTRRRSSPRPAAGPGICVVGYQWHATELLDDVRGALAGQRVGMLVGRNYGPVAGRPWFMDQAQGGGQILERGSHHIDLQRAIAGEIVAVEATAGPCGSPGRTRAASIDDSISLTCSTSPTARWAPSTACGRGTASPELYATDVLAEEATIALELGPEAYRLRGTSRGGRRRSEHGEPMFRSIDRLPGGCPQRRHVADLLPAVRRDPHAGRRAGLRAGDRDRAGGPRCEAAPDRPRRHRRRRSRRARRAARGAGAVARAAARTATRATPSTTPAATPASS